jgi:hypothetical protein
MPEVIENICVSFKSMFTIDLPSIFLRNTSSCIVKFVEEDSTLNHLVAALRFLYFVYNGSNDFIENPIYCGEVGSDQIIEVEFLDPSFADIRY